VRVSGKADRAEGLLRLQDTDTSLITFREKQLSLAQNNSVTDKKVQILETRGKETQFYNTARVCLCLGDRRKHTLQDNPILQARILMAEGSSSTLGIDNTLQGPPLRRGGWVPHVMQAGSEQKKPNRRARCVQPPSGYKRLSTFAQTNGRKGRATMQAACNRAKWARFSDSQHAQHGGPGPRVMQPARRMLRACNSTATRATTVLP
jgi:hypothetical protein